MNPLKTAPSTPGALRFSGPDARAFLQGQLTHDLALLTPSRPLLAAHCNPQGRVFALVTLVADGDDVIALLPTSLTAPLHDRLRKYVLRAKVKIADATADLPALSISGLLPVSHLPAASRSSSPVEAAVPSASLADIAAGRPQIYPEASELFVAQMLNLDILDGISFTKGCYTGQEVIARAHYRGKVKRRMQRFRTLTPAALSPGEAGRLSDGRPFTVVTAAQLENGRSEFLAVTALNTTDGEAAQSSGPSVEAEPLPLPYTFP